MRKCFASLSISELVNNGPVVLQQLAQARQSMQENASSWAL